MLSLIILEMVIGGTLLALLVYFYNEAKWQKWSAARLDRTTPTTTKSKSAPDPSGYKTDGVVY